MTLLLLLLGSGGFSFHRFFPKMYIFFLYLLTRVKTYPPVLEGFLLPFTYKAPEMFCCCFCARVWRKNTSAELLCATESVALMCQTTAGGHWKCLSIARLNSHTSVNLDFPLLRPLFLWLMRVGTAAANPEPEEPAQCCCHGEIFLVLYTGMFL